MRVQNAIANGTSEEWSVSACFENVHGPSDAVRDHFFVVHGPSDAVRDHFFVIQAIR